MKLFLSALLLTCMAAGGANAKNFVNVGGWLLLETKDAMTDKGRGIASTRGNGPSIVIKCDAGGSDNSMYVQFTADRYLGGTDDNLYRRVMVRFDADQPITHFWYHNDDVAIMSSPDAVKEFVTRIATAQKIAVRATTYDLETVDAVIAVAGGREAIGRAYKACGHTPPFGG